MKEKLPDNWQDCTKEQLLYLSEHGSYGQRLIAKRYLRTTVQTKQSKQHEKEANQNTV